MEVERETNEEGVGEEDLEQHEACQEDVATGDLRFVRLVEELGVVDGARLVEDVFGHLEDLEEDQQGRHFDDNPLDLIDLLKLRDFPGQVIQCEYAQYKGQPLYVQEHTEVIFRALGLRNIFAQF